LAVQSAIESDRTFVYVTQGSRVQRQEVLIAVPLALEHRHAASALVAQGKAIAPSTAVVQAVEQRARQLAAMLFAPEAAKLASDISPDQTYELEEFLLGARRDVLMHELRAPLGAISYTLAQLATRSAVAKSAYAMRLLHTAQLAIEDAQVMLRWFSQIQTLVTGVASPTLTAVSVKETVDRALALLPAMATHVQVAVPENIPPVHADQLWLTHVLTNLLENAVKYAAPSAVAQAVATGTVEGDVIISVTTPGGGIPRGAQQMVFRPYVRGARSDDLTSKGLGLSITQHLVTAMGGEISVESDGTTNVTFRVKLPAFRKPPV
jgi:two-component system sensor histidine kinase KdpD